MNVAFPQARLDIWGSLLAHRRSRHGVLLTMDGKSLEMLTNLVRY